MVGYLTEEQPAVRFGSFVRFRVWSSVQPQNVAWQHFGSFEDLGRQPATFGPRGTPWRVRPRRHPHRVHPGLVDIRAARNFSRFAPPPGAAHFSRFARATDP